MKPTLAVLTALICLMFSASAGAQTITGSDIISKCKQAIASADSLTPASISHFDAGFCSGFMAGVNEDQVMWQASDKMDHRDHLLSYCFPDASTNGQLLRVFVKYLDDHPEELHESAAFLYLKAMHRAFPCGK
jgi:hypothetical protein